MATPSEKRRERRERAAQAAARVREIAERGGRVVAPSDGAVMVLVPAGPFFQGRSPGDIFAPEPETPGREVTLSAFLIDREPVTNERFARFLEAGGYVDPHDWSPAGWSWRVRADVSRPLSFETPGFDGADQPVAGVSWFEAEAYARWAGKLLPTEAQWEKAARGSADRRLFPWGDALPRSALCNFNGEVGRTTPVGAYPAGNSPYGCVDMAGNVNNWCRDWHWDRFYAHAEKVGLSKDPWLSDDLRVKLSQPLQEKSDRGGGYATGFACFEVLAVTGRLAWAPQKRNLWNGFRCVTEL